MDIIKKFVDHHMDKYKEGNTFEADDSFRSDQKEVADALGLNLQDPADERLFRSFESMVKDYANGTNSYDEIENKAAEIQKK